VLLALVGIVAVGGLATLFFFVALALTSARSLQRATEGARAQLMPAVQELTAWALEIAERARRLRR
jgi:hypothetical protein